MVLLHCLPTPTDIFFSTAPCSTVPDCAGVVRPRSSRDNYIITRDHSCAYLLQKGPDCRNCNRAGSQCSGTSGHICCVPIQGLHPLEAAFEGQLHHSAAWWLSQFEGSSKCSPQMRPSFPSFWRVHRYYPSWTHISQDSLHTRKKKGQGENGDIA